MKNAICQKDYFGPNKTQWWRWKPKSTFWKMPQREMLTSSWLIPVLTMMVELAMEALSSSATHLFSSSSSSSPSLSIISLKVNHSHLLSRFLSFSKSKRPFFFFFFFLYLSLNLGILNLKGAAMGLVLSAASVRGWTTGSGMEGPSVPVGAEDE